MKQEVTNFYQFYSTFNRLPYHDNKECLKHLLDISHDVAQVNIKHPE